MFHADGRGGGAGGGQTDRQRGTDMAKLTVAFRNFAKLSKNFDKAHRQWKK
jgi:hypothetical protein